MYYLKRSVVYVPVKYFYAMKQECSFKGSKIYNRMAIRRGKSEIISQGLKKECKDTIRNYINTIVETDDGYYLTEYYIVENDEILPNIIQNEYELETKRGKYTSQEVNAMIKIIRHLKVYYSLASLVAYERYGFIQKVDHVLVYKDERQIITINAETMELTVEKY